MPVDLDTIVEKVWDIAPVAIGGYIIWKWIIEPQMKKDEFNPFEPFK